MRTHAIAAFAVTLFASPPLFAQSEPPPPARVTIAAPAPAPIVRTRIEPRGESLHYFTGPAAHTYFGVRLALGGGGQSAPGNALSAEFTGDLMARLRVSLSRGDLQPALWFEGGYSLGAGGGAIENLAGVGFGPAILWGPFAFSYLPRFELGSASGLLAVGVRNAISVELGSAVSDYFGATSVGLVLAHQVLFTDTGAIHDVTLALSVDFFHLGALGH
jgi:hypothetical protein